MRSLRTIQLQEGVDPGSTAAFWAYHPYLSQAGLGCFSNIITSRNVTDPQGLSEAKPWDHKWGSVL